ncbi:hypothetical protein BKA57DRAFT_17108 [Linnemannia elongata]|nr:hypothetical protein BKA57DRAFT_17108 [Linnemannia elongata]
MYTRGSSQPSPWLFSLSLSTLTPQTIPNPFFAHSPYFSFFSHQLLYSAFVHPPLTLLHSPPFTAIPTAASYVHSASRADPSKNKNVHFQPQLTIVTETTCYPSFPCPSSLALIYFPDLNPLSMVTSTPHLYPLRINPHLCCFVVLLTSFRVNPLGFFMNTTINQLIRTDQYLYVCLTS